VAKIVKLLSEEELANGRFRLTRTEAEVVEADGSQRLLRHEIYHYKSAAAALLYDARRAIVLLVRQFRLGAYIADGALETLEVCAGMLDGEEPDVCIRREVLEEAGIRADKLERAFDFYPSPGGSTEIIHCFFAPYGAQDRVAAGGGVDADEHLEAIEMPFQQALELIEAGRIRDGKTVALLYAAAAKRVFSTA